MKNALIVFLGIALLLSWLGFFTWQEHLSADGETAAMPGGKDTITVWINEMLGTPDEAHYYELADCWNTTHPNVKIKMVVMSHAGYESKLRVAVASGQPPDVCISGFETFESLQYSGKATDQAIAIPEELLPLERLEAMGPVVQKAAVRDGKQYVFPIYRYCYGGVMLVNRTMLREAGYDDEQLRRDGWTFKEFREACKRMTRDTDGDGQTDVWGFGAGLVHLEHLVNLEFGPGAWGKKVAERFMLGYDENTGRWTRHPDLKEEQIYQIFLLFHQLINVDKSWNPATLGMGTYEMLDEIITQQKLAMSFGSIPWAPKVYEDIRNLEISQGVKKPNPFPDLTMVWTPTLKAGDHASPSAGVYGFSVLKQTPYKGDAHTYNACRVALFLTHPVHLARSQLRQFRHLPPEPERFAKIYPELLNWEDPWVQFYNEVMDSGNWHIPVAQASDTPDLPEYIQVLVKRDLWLRKTGLNYLEQVIYEKMTPEDAAHRFYVELKETADNAYDEIQEEK